MPSDTTKRDEAGGSRDPAVRTYRPQHATATTAQATGGAAEVGGRKDGTEPTRFGDWEKQGRCIDF